MTLYEKVYTAISKPSCGRCQNRLDWGASDCDKNLCHDDYAASTDKILEIIKAENIGVFKNCMDLIKEFFDKMAQDTRLPEEARKVMQKASSNWERYIGEIMKLYEEDWDNDAHNK